MARNIRLPTSTLEEAVLRLTASDHPALLAMSARFPEKVAAQ
jgi:hypothetical protein